MPDPERERAKKVFDFFDEDKDNSININELQALIFKLGEILTQEQVQVILQTLDTDGNGVLSFEEFYAWWISEDRDHQNETGERMRFLKMKLTSQTYFKSIKKQSKALKNISSSKTPVTGVDTYRLDVSVNFGNCAKPVAGIHIHYEKNEEKANAFRKRCNYNDHVLAALTLVCTPEATQDNLTPFTALLDPLLKQLKKEGLPLNSITGNLTEEEGPDGVRKVWRLVALPKPKTNAVVLGVLGVVGLKQFDVDVDLSGEKFLEGKTRIAAEISKSVTSLLSEVGKDIPEQLTLLLSTFGNAETVFRFKGIGEGFSNTAFQEFLFKDLLDLRDTDQASSRGKEAFTKLLGENNPTAFVDALLKEIFVFDREEKLWPYYTNAYSVFSGLGDLVLAAGDHVLTVEFQFPNLKSYFASPEVIEDWRKQKENYQLKV